jgi:hypothetical protein
VENSGIHRAEICPLLHRDANARLEIGLRGVLKLESKKVDKSLNNQPFSARNSLSLGADLQG